MIAREPHDDAVAPQASGPSGPAPPLEALLNLSRVHKEHERFYASSPLESALRLQRHARTLQALADRWAATDPSPRQAVSPYEGADDLNSEAAIALDGALFLEGQGRPPELTAMIGELRTEAAGVEGTGQWLATAMQASWTGAAALLDVDGLAGVMGERHRIISNDWLSAHMQTLIGQLLTLAADMLDRIALTPSAIRADLAADRSSPRRLHDAAEVISRAADLCCESAALVHDNERRWRVVRERVREVVRTMSAAVPGPGGSTSFSDRAGSGRR